MSAEHDHGSSSCLDLLEKLSEYLDGDLPPSICEEIEAHIADCEPCVRFVRSLRNTVSHVGAVPPVEMPDDVRRACIEAFARRCRDGS